LLIEIGEREKKLSENSVDADYGMEKKVCEIENVEVILTRTVRANGIVILLLLLLLQQDRIC